MANAIKPILILAATTLLLPLYACKSVRASTESAGPIPNVTNIVIGPEPLLTNAKRLGININGQDFYDSGQMLRNVTFRNPGFESGTWQSILHCKTVTNNTCTDENQYTTWPAEFLKGAHYEDLTNGATGEVQTSTISENNHGIVLTLTSAPKAGDFILLHEDKPGNADAGWWKSLQGGATLATENHDVSPNTPGKQALRVDASAAGQSASVSSYFDSYTGRSFLQLRGHYVLTFRAKRLSGTQPVNVRIERLDTAHGANRFFSQDLPLTTAWKDYTFAFDANEARSALGTVGLTFYVNQSAILLDDVALTASAAPNNPTPFRNEVVQTLRELRPGVLRYMDSGGDFGSSIDNMLAPVFARRRAGSSTQENLHEDIPLGLHEFLQLCEAVGAEPWYSMPPGASPAEAAALVEYLAAPATTPYGHKRAALGHPAPWTSSFPKIHLELGNEEWNARAFYGSAINDPTAYAKRASTVYAAMRSAPAFQPKSFDLILGSWATVPWWTAQELSSASGVDSVAVAPYLFTEFKDASSIENIFGPMLAQPEMIDAASGYMGQQRDAARKPKVDLAIYETNLGTMSGTVFQPDIDQTVPSLGAGLASTEHMLLMLRDLGVTTQCLFALPEFVNNFLSTSGGPTRTIPLWGAVVDMGGATDLRRPSFYTMELANAAILPTLLATHLSAPNPTWKQAKSANDSVELAAAHLIQTFAFTDGKKHTLILFNLSRTDALPVTISGAVRPSGAVTEQGLTAAHITDSNEQTAKVMPTSRVLAGFDASRPYQLPPFSMTVLSW